MRLQALRRFRDFHPKPMSGFAAGSHDQRQRNQGRVPMKQQLQEFLFENLSHLPVETLIAGSRQVEIVKPISWKGVDYAGPDSRLVHGLGQFLALPVAEVKELYKQRVIRI